MLSDEQNLSEVKLDEMLNEYLIDFKGRFYRKEVGDTTVQYIRNLKMAYYESMKSYKT